MEATQELFGRVLHQGVSPACWRIVIAKSLPHGQKISTAIITKVYPALGSSLLELTAKVLRRGKTVRPQGSTRYFSFLVWAPVSGLVSSTPLELAHLAQRGAEEKKNWELYVPVSPPPGPP